MAFLPKFSDREKETFKKVAKEIKPNFTQIPNAILDNVSEFTPAEFIIICVIARQTYGWHKDSDKISLSQYKKKSGLSRQGVINSINSLEKLGWISVIRSKSGNKYCILDAKVVNSVDQEKGEVVNSVDQGSQLSRPEVVNSVDIQNKHLNKLDKINLEAQKEPPLMRRVTDMICLASESLTTKKLVWNKADGVTIARLIKKLDGSDEDKYNEIRERVKMLYIKLKKGYFIKGDGLTALTLSSNWNELAPVDHTGPDNPFVGKEEFSMKHMTFEEKKRLWDNPTEWDSIYKEIKLSRGIG